MRSRSTPALRDEKNEKEGGRRVLTAPAPSRTQRVARRVDPVPLIPVLALLGLVVWVIAISPTTLSYNGFDLLLSSAIPFVFATLSEMVIVALGDIDLGIGYFVGLTNVVAAQIMAHDAALGGIVLVGCVLAYMAMGLLVSVRRIPSIIVTLGASFVWLGIGQLILPTPGGSVPVWLQDLFALRSPLIPLPVVMIVVILIVTSAIIYRSPAGIALRGYGSNPLAVEAAGRNATAIRVGAYGLAGLFGVLGGLSVTAVTASGDVTASANYTLLAVAAVILGGGEFAGGRASVLGTIAGALTLSVVGSLMGIINVSSSLQTGVEGLILIAVLAGRRLLRASLP